MALARHFGWGRLLVGVVLQCLIWYAVTRDPVQRPILGDYHVVLWPVATLICPTLVPHGFSFLRRADIVSNWTQVRSLAWAQWTVLNLALGLAGVGQPDLLRYWRNQLLCMGIAALVTALAPLVIATMTPVVLGMLVWLFGSSIVAPPSWNLLLYPQESVPAAAIAVGLFLAGTTLLLRRSVHSVDLQVHDLG